MVDIARLRRAFARMADLTEDEAREIAEDLQRRIAEVEERYRVARALDDTTNEEEP